MGVEGGWGSLQAALSHYRAGGSNPSDVSLATSPPSHHFMGPGEASRALSLPWLPVKEPTALPWGRGRAFSLQAHTFIRPSPHMAICTINGIFSNKLRPPRTPATQPRGVPCNSQRQEHLH